MRVASLKGCPSFEDAQAEIESIAAALHHAQYLDSFFANCVFAHLEMSGVDVPIGRKFSIGNPLYSLIGTPLMKSSAGSKLQVAHMVKPPHHFGI